MNTSRKNSQESSTLSSLFLIIFKTDIFLFLSQVFLIFLYVAGNFQNFLDSTQHMILFLSGIFSILLFFFS
ncbi:MAG: hypothetical protein SOZ24_01080, partial [Treponema sp.]|nr:hypothetical protein [Treponema sp.]